eukprot:PhM_4_TR7746/c0_g1_i2/m.49909/K20027/ZDHHC1_11; palmitoyltransferase ZDHHC1/11
MTQQPPPPPPPPIDTSLAQGSATTTTNNNSAHVSNTNPIASNINNNYNPQPPPNNTNLASSSSDVPSGNFTPREGGAGSDFGGSNYRNTPTNQMPGATFGSAAASARSSVVVEETVPPVKVDVDPQPCVREWPCCSDSHIMESNSWERQPPRRHGFHRPLHFLQIMAWFFFVMFYVLYWFFAVPYVPEWGYIVTHATISALFVISIGSMFVVSLVDTQDHGQDALAPEKGAHIYCFTCRRYIARSSKHCKACNRCVKGFDHHCKWLNVCVGVQNYRSFFVYVTSTLACVCCYIALVVYLIVRTFMFGDDVEDDIDDSAPDMNLIGLQVALFVILFLLFVAFGLLGHLFGFHCMLQFRGITTYEWIMEQREIARQMAEAEEARQAEIEMEQQTRAAMGLDPEEEGEDEAASPAPRSGVSGCIRNSSASSNNDNNNNNNNNGGNNNNNNNSGMDHSPTISSSSHHHPHSVSASS